MLNGYIILSKFKRIVDSICFVDIALFSIVRIWLRVFFIFSLQINYTQWLHIHTHTDFTCTRGVCLNGQHHGIDIFAKLQEVMEGMTLIVFNNGLYVSNFDLYVRSSNCVRNL